MTCKPPLHLNRLGTIVNRGVVPFVQTDKPLSLDTKMAAESSMFSRVNGAVEESQREGGEKNKKSTKTATARQGSRKNEKGLFPGRRLVVLNSKVYRVL